MINVRTLNGVLVTSCSDERRARRIAAGMEHRYLQYDQGAAFFFCGGDWDFGWAAASPVDQFARQQLQAELERLMAVSRERLALARRGVEG